MTYVEKLEEWYRDAKDRGEVYDLKICHEGASFEATCKAAYETLTGVRESEEVSMTEL